VKIEIERSLAKTIKRLHDEAIEDMAQKRKADLKAKTRVFDC